MLKHITSIWNRYNRNNINNAIDHVNMLGKTIQDLVAEGQLTEEQYAELLTTINSLVKSGNVDKSDLTSEFKDEIEGFSAQLAQIPQQTYITEKAKTVDVNNALSLKTDKTYTDYQLSLKRDKATKITGTELDTSADANKVQLINLSEEVQSAMAGTSPVISTVADGSLTNEKYAEGSVGLSKLNTDLQKATLYQFDDWETGGISSSNGSNNTDTKFKRVAGTYYADVGDNIKLSNLTYRLGIYRLNLDGTFKEYLSYQSNYVFTEECLFRVSLYKVDGTDISTEDAEVLGTYVTAYFYNQKPTKGKNIVPKDIRGINLGDKIIDWSHLKQGLVRQYEDDIIYYGAYEGVNVERIASTNEAVVNFSESYQRIFYRTKDGLSQVNLPVLTYKIPSDSALVINRITNQVEVVSFDNLIRGTHLLLMAARFGVIIKSNIRYKEHLLNTIIPEHPRPIEEKYSFSFAISQDGCVVEDEIWLFHESLETHDGISVIHRLDKTTLAEKGDINHNLGHANGVDYRNGKLLVYNGARMPPEINLYSSPYGKTDLLFTDTDNIQIVFSEGSKLLEGDGSACFGENEKIVYYNAGLTIYKILLGMGDNDLSDKTAYKSDMTRWGSFVSGKIETEYNGTAKVLGTFKASDSLSYAQLQPQGMTYDGYLYLVTGYQKCHAYKVQLLNNGTFKVEDDYIYNHTDYKNDPIHIEPQCAFIVKQHIYIGARRSGESFIVKMNL